MTTPTAAPPDRATARRILRRGWRVFVPVVLGNAAVQAATTVPFLTPAATVWFVLLTLASAAAIVVGAVLVVAQAGAVAGETRVRMPGRSWLAASVTVVVVGAAALVAPPLILVALPIAFLVLPGDARGQAFAGFRAFATLPARAIGLTIVTLVTLVVLWIAALLLGFFMTGVISAALTWLAFGAAAVVLTCAWTALIERGSSSSR